MAFSFIRLLPLLAALASAQQPADEFPDNAPVNADLTAEQAQTLIQHIEGVFQ